MVRAEPCLTLLLTAGLPPGDRTGPLHRVVLNHDRLARAWLLANELVRPVHPDSTSPCPGGRRRRWQQDDCTDGQTDPPSLARCTHRAGLGWVIAPFLYGLYQPVIKKPALFGG